ncbi:hypothetical protein Scep_021868 [Stephania cephalantha]|uniref:Transposase n=1 Tax=Stephania cephalantha TaxID=152367 RepID=A0AAP0FF34_9MAGN
MSQRNIPILFYAYGSIVNGVNGIAYSSPPSVVLWVKFGSSAREMIDDVSNAFPDCTASTIVHMTYRHMMPLPGGSHYYVPVLLNDATHFDLMWDTVDKLPKTTAIDIYLTFESVDSNQNRTIHSQVLDERGGTPDADLLDMDRLHMQSPADEVAQEGFVAPLHEDNNAYTDDDANDDENNETDEETHHSEEAPSVAVWDDVNVCTDDPTYDPPGAENVEDDEQFAIDEEIMLEEASDDEVHQPIPGYNEIDWEVANSTATQHSRKQTWGDIPNFDLEIGMCFDNKNDLQHAVKVWHVNRHCQYHVMESTTTSWAIKCRYPQHGCMWRLRACFRKKTLLWEITQLDVPHTCINPNVERGHAQLDANMMAREIQSVVKTDQGVTIKTLVEIIKKKYGHEVNYKLMWDAKKKAIEWVFGDWDESYAQLPRWLAAVRSKSPGTRIEWSHRQWHDDEISTASPQFRRVFFAFEASIQAFKFCRPLLQIDATFLYGRYSGKLMIALSVEGNGHILPVAFAVAETESTDSWGWFLRMLRKHVTDREGICVISDRHQEGHRRTTCPNKDRERVPTRKNRCGICRLEGHNKKNCPLRPQPSNDNL